MQYKVWFTTSDSILTPILQDVNISVLVTGVDEKITNTDNNVSYFSLKQNYPNPFNPITRICYSIPEISNVTITVFDILGNEIETVVNEDKPVGTYEITWNAANLPSGIYFYRLQSGEFVETKKMVLMK